MLLLFGEQNKQAAYTHGGCGSHGCSHVSPDLLAVDKLGSAAMPLRFVLFHSVPYRSYRLIYGNARAKAPQYDLTRTLQIPPLEAMFRPGLGSEEVTSNYADPRPFTE